MLRLGDLFCTFQLHGYLLTTAYIQSGIKMLHTFAIAQLAKFLNSEIFWPDFFSAANAGL
jgi:hypothetical protein